MTAASNNIHTYSDIRTALEKLVSLGGRSAIEFPTFQQATVWVVRAYKFRKLLRQQMEAARPGEAVVTPYDSMVIQHDKKSRSSIVHVSWTPIDMGARIVLEDGTRLPLISPEDTPVPAVQQSDIGIPLTDEDNLLAEALQMVQDLGLK